MCGNNKYEEKESCLLADLLKSSPLEYVAILNEDSGSNAVSSMVIPGTKESLRFVYILQIGDAYDIKYDISESFPEDLRVLTIVTVKDGTPQFGNIVGSEENMEKLVTNLVLRLWVWQNEEENGEGEEEGDKAEKES